MLYGAHEMPQQTIESVMVNRMNLKHGYYQSRSFDNIAAVNAFELMGQKVYFQLLSSDHVYQETGMGKKGKEEYLSWKPLDWPVTEDTHYNITLKWNSRELGTPGALIVRNMHAREFFLRSLTLQVPGKGNVQFHCDSWIYPACLYKSDRVFFANRSYHPEATPAGLVGLRNRELVELRGDGSGQRKFWDRVYDYDVYNDLGEPDVSHELRREVLGGTGRPPTITDGAFESRTVPPISFYTPPDEKYPHSNLSDYRAHFVRAFAKKIVPTLKSLFGNEFKSLADVKDLYSRGILSPLCHGYCSRGNTSSDGKGPTQALVSFIRPHVIGADEYAWRNDEEFARQALSGINPMAIQCLQSFPPSSSLDADKYGPQQSSITAQHIENNLQGLSVKQPVAIELCLPPTAVAQSVRDVYTPVDDVEGGGLWLLAKAHARVNDAGYHQLVSHGLRTHAVIEPFIIATHRQLSNMHPLHKLLVTHFLDTMGINQSARQSLISAGGIVEQVFITGKYSMEISAKAYIDWRLNEQGLPADLLKRGMAVPDPTATHGLRLVVEDYPYAVDGLEIWAALKSWVSDYMSLYYKSDDAIKADKELQGGGEALTTIIWLALAHHAAVNFGQYPYGGYMPNLPTIGRRLLPQKGSVEYSEFLADPDAYFLKTVSNPSQATTTMAVLELLSKHSTDEVYLGQVKGSTLEWTNDAAVEQAFRRFSLSLEQVEKNVCARNDNPHLKNRVGPAMFPYTLLYPSTTDLSRKGGLTARGVPNSISI
eukprot:Gb_41561 [translate_table: standard]